jgi:hypothetical protein
VLFTDGLRTAFIWAALLGWEIGLASLTSDSFSKAGYLLCLSAFWIISYINLDLSAFFGAVADADLSACLSESKGFFSSYPSFWVIEYSIASVLI